MRHKYRKYQAICNKNLNNKYNPRLNKREKRDYLTCIKN